MGIMFQQIDVTNWGIDWDGHVAEPDSQAVEVPVTPQDLHQTVEKHLRAYIDPFMSSDVFGVDILPASPVIGPVRNVYTNIKIWTARPPPLAKEGKEVCIYYQCLIPLAEIHALS